MKAIQMLPYWEDNRRLLLEIIEPLKAEHLEFRLAPGLRTLGESLRHIITTEEFWWRGGIQGEPYASWRPAAWERLSTEEKDAYRAQRFPSLASIREGLGAVHAPVAAFLGELEVADLCLKRQATWGKENTLRWIFWHLVEHDQHHRGQIFTRLRLLGYDPPSTFPRPAVMGWTPAGVWQPDDVEIRTLLPFWGGVHAVLHRAIGALSQADLSFRPADGLPSIHDLLIHVFTWEDFLIRQNLKGEVDRDWWKIDGSFWKVPVHALAAQIGDRFPSMDSLLEGLSAVHEATMSFIDELAISDLAMTHWTPWGPQTLHHTLWYAREHTVHHRAQLFLRMRMLGVTPPDL